MSNAISMALLLSALPATTQDAPPAREVRVTIVLRGAESVADVAVLTKALLTVKGVNVVTDSVERGFRRFNNRFTSPIVVTIPMIPGDNDANVGALATAVSKAGTSHREKFAPGVNLLLFTDDPLNESSISALRSSLTSVNGVEVHQPGGLGGNPQEGWCWIQLENAGGAMLKDIEQHAQASELKLRRVKNLDK